MDSRAAVWTTNNDQGSISPHGPTGVPPAINDKTTYFVNNPFLIAVQSKFRRKYYHKVVFAILIVIIILLIIAIICLAVRAHYAYQVCETKECLRSASNLILTMDQTVDPCDDFYKFTCGNWPEQHPRPDSVTSYDWFSEKQAKIMRQIRTFLQENSTSSDPEAVKKIKIMYKACTDIDGMNKLGIAPVLNYLKEFKLPLIPSILNQTQKNNDNDDENVVVFDWIETIVNIKKGIGMDILIGFDIFPDPANRSINRIALGTPESESALPFNDEDNHIRLKKAKKKFIGEQSVSKTDEETEEESPKSQALTAYLTYIQKVLAIIIMTVDPNANMEEIVEGVATAAVEVVRITKFVFKLTEEAENTTTKSGQNLLDDLIYLNIDKLQKETDKLISPSTLPLWKKYLTFMTSDVPNLDINLDKEIYLSSKADIKYLQLLVQFIQKTSSANLEFYIWWNVVEELILHTTAELRQLHNEYTRLVIQTEGTTSRSLYCASGINSLMGMAVSYAIVDEKFINQTRPKVEYMLNNIREAFNKLVKQTSWMDEGTRVETLKKSGNMKSFIGFPEWILNKTKLDDYYSDIDANETTHLDNMMGIIKWQSKKKIEKAKKINTYDWATAPSNVNAFHTFQSNTITIPIAILQFPFYELGLEALNYGAIGTILGHELTHGFDDSGRMFDKSGNMRQWWSNATITEYINRTACFVKQYSKFYLPDIKEYVNGELTLGENIADNGGLREAYYAYKILINEKGKEKRLPGLEKYSHEQLLFISFGNLWCETFTPAASRYAVEDSHCPGRIRLKGVLSNSPEFSEAFNCRKGSGMYPAENRCRIW